MVRQYAAIKSQLDEINSRERQLKEAIRQQVMELGIVDEKGSVSLDVDDKLSGVSKIVNQRRVSKRFDPSVAEDLLTEKGLLERCTMMIPALDEEEILAARYEDLLTDEDIDTMFPASESFAFIFVKDS